MKPFLGLEDVEYNQIIKNTKLRKEIIDKVIIHNENFPGSSTKIKKVALMDSPPSFDNNEITDKGYVNQSSALEVRSHLVELLYDDSEEHDEVIIIR